MGSCENGTTAVLQALAKHELREGESQMFCSFLEKSSREKAWEIETALHYIARSVSFITCKETCILIFGNLKSLQNEEKTDRSTWLHKCFDCKFILWQAT